MRIGEMGTKVTVQMTPEGLLIPRDALGDLAIGELEAVRTRDAIIVRPKRAFADERERVRHALRAAGLLCEPDWKTPLPVSPDERARLVRKLAQGCPLSESIIADREDRI
jgi:hypothetical protein